MTTTETMGSLDGLIAALEEATGADREIDARIWCAFAGVRYRDHHELYGGSRCTQVVYTEPPRRTECVTRDKGAHRHAEPYTASLDAALALVGEKLPGHHAGVMVEDRHGDGSMTWGAWVDNRCPDTEIQFAKQPAIALLIALLRTLQSKTGDQ